jgi:hypothetical protein
MSIQVEGTFFVKGLIEGHLGSSEVNSEIEKWVQKVSGLGLPFVLEIDGGKFSVLAESNILKASSFTKSPSDLVTLALNDLLKIFPIEKRGDVFSTIHSVEYLPKREIQTLYTVAPIGEIETQDRVLDADTVAPPEPLTLRKKIKIAIAGLLIVVFAFSISAFFIDYRALYRDFVDRAIPVDTADLKVHNDCFKLFFTVEKVEKGKSMGSLVLTLKRTPVFPLTPRITEAILAADRNNVERRLAVEAIVRGYIRCEYYDNEKKFMKYTEVRIAPLFIAETVKIEIPLPQNHRLRDIVLKY